MEISSSVSSDSRFKASSQLKFAKYFNDRKSNDTPKGNFHSYRIWPPMLILIQNQSKKN